MVFMLLASCWNGEPDPEASGRMLYKFKMVLFARNPKAQFDVAKFVG
jgi:hypothetical protein